ncbi:hypothetical protein AGOR_G00094220 [Albula goreensis]|uniref:Rab-GAP TBC domain-containing protein n=1 Tax=Albula goreensis TaxID=1534307 RepID=A0A8T3DGH8_9TELE|nr:hypothetical protein AGOR_G00094220 [Albula goreensis]
MAEVSTLTPSPPGLGDAHISSSLPGSSDPQMTPSDFAKHSSVTKSALYGDPAVTASPQVQTVGHPNGRESYPVPHDCAPQASALDDTVTTPAECLEISTEGSVAEDTSTGAVLPAVQEQEAQGTCEEGLVITYSHPVESEGQGADKQDSSFPSIDPNPNLSPNNNVNENCPVTEPQPQCIPPASTHPLNFSLPTSGITCMTSDTTITPTVAQNSQQTQDDSLKQSPISQIKISEKPEPPSSPKILEPPITPKIQHSSPVSSIQESPAMLSLPNPHQRPAPDTLSYLESASLMSGTLESLSGLGEDGSSLGSDSEVSGLVFRRTDKYGFLGGAQYSEGSERDVSVDVARQREMKWLDMFNHWDKWISRRFQKVKLRCRKGIPSSLRAKAWQLLSNSKDLLDSNPGKFEALEREQGDHKWLDIIEKDLHRQFPFHEMFAARGGHGQQDLYRILKAYTVYRPEEGYCQAQAPVAAVLLMHMPAEQAFWCLVQICETYLPGYYSAGLEAIQLDGEIFFSLLRRVCPMAYRHLKKFKIDPILYMTEWFMCVFSRTLPWACVLRVWDMFFCEGVKVVFRVGLVLLRQMLGSVDKLRELQGMYETMERLRNIPLDSVREEWLVQEVISLGVTEAIIERENTIQVRKWRESRGELTHQPGRRLHGARAIHEMKLRSASSNSRGSFSFLGGAAPSPGPLRASSSLLSLPGFRKSKASVKSQAKKGSFSGSSTSDPAPVQSLQGPSSTVSPSHKPSSSGGPGAHSELQPQSARGPPFRAPQDPAQHPAAPPVQDQAATPAHSMEPPQNLTPSHTISSKTIPKQSTTNKPPATSTTALSASMDRGAGAAQGGEEDGKKLKKSKEEKKREKEEEKQRAREQKEREKAEKERQKKEKKREKGGKKKDKGGSTEPEEKNGAKARRESHEQAAGQSSSQH